RTLLAALTAAWGLRLGMYHGVRPAGLAGHRRLAAGAGGSAAMTLLLLKVTGVTLLEKSLVVSNPQYADYQHRTSGFMPWRPRSP
ncbi:MAG: hypothetical protein ACREVZ_08800, partial [Burkholderiales bacterium]